MRAADGRGPPVDQLKSRDEHAAHDLIRRIVVVAVLGHAMDEPLAERLMAVEIGGEGGDELLEGEPFFLNPGPLRHGCGAMIVINERIEAELLG